MLTTLPDLKAVIFKDMMKYTKELLGRIQLHFKSFSLVFFFLKISRVSAISLFIWRVVKNERD